MSIQILIVRFKGKLSQLQGFLKVGRSRVKK
jgi:hypothetical protein